MKADFPFVRKFVDCAGTKRSFLFTLKDLGDTFYVEAKEQTPSEDGGYEFGAINPSIPHAVGDLTSKIRKALCTKYLSKDPHYTGFYSDEAIGRIADDGIVIDGELVPYDKFCDMLATYNGFKIEIKIKDKSE